MFNISLNNQITISRGDTATYSLCINLGTSVRPDKYILQSGDKLYLSVVENNCKYRDVFEEFNNGLIRKEMTEEDLDDDNNVIIEFLSTDTQTLLPGTYYYSIKLKRSDNSITTILNKTKFIIME